MRISQMTTLVVIACCLGVGVVRAQDDSNPDRILAPARGILTSRAYQFLDISTVNMTTGGLFLKIPLATLPPSPGGESFGAVLYYNSKYWETYSLQFPSGQFEHTLVGAPAGGWRLQFGYTLESVDLEVRPLGDPCAGGGVGPLTTLRLTHPDGAEHKLLWAGIPYMAQGCEVGVYRLSDIAPNRVQAQRQVWYSIDGSYLRLEMEAGSPWPLNDWTLYEPSGARVVFSAATSETTRYDRNGNWVKWQRTTSGIPTDTLSDAYGNSIQILHHPDPRDEVQQTGYNGQTLTWNVFWADEFVNFQKMYYSSGNYEPIYFSGFPLLVSRVELPARSVPGSSPYTPAFQFSYNNARYKELSSMTLPSLATEMINDNYIDRPTTSSTGS